MQLILFLPAESLPVSENFKEMMNDLDISSLYELLNYSIAELLKFEGLGFRVVKELFAVLEKYQMEDLLKQ